MRTDEQIKTAVETIALLQDYIELAKAEKKLKSPVAKEQTEQIINDIVDKASRNTTEVL